MKEHVCFKASNNQENGENEVSLEKQRELIKDCVDPSFKEGDSWYLITVDWWNQWKEYVDYEYSNSTRKTRKPGPIDNSSLLSSEGVLEEKKRENEDFIPVPETAWQYLSKWYGIQEEKAEVKCPVIEAGSITKELRLEYRPLKLLLAHYKKPTAGKATRCSSAMTVGALVQQMRTMYDIAEGDDVKLVGSFDSANYEDISDRDTLSTAGLMSDQFVVILEKEKGEWADPNTYKNMKTSSTDSKLKGTSTSAAGTSTSSSSVTGSSSYTNGFGSNRYYSRYDDHREAGLCGLSNLGNTCFMNSALQCLSNVPDLTSYFVGNKYKPEINKDNPLGMHGQIAEEYADLVKVIWSGKHSSTSPGRFKRAVGSFAPRFSGYQQQDSQELMAFLLDGLHEDLNRIHKKPYVEAKASDGRPDAKVAAEAWSDYKLRNDSVIIDLFHGQLKSRLDCPREDCGNVSVTFDPFCYLSLPLPRKLDRIVKFTFISKYGSNRPIRCKVKIPKNGNASQLTYAISKLLNIPEENLRIMEIFNNRFRYYYSSNRYLSLHDSSSIYVYDVSPESEDCVDMHVYLNDYDSASTKSINRRQFGMPLLISVPNRITYVDLCNLLRNTCDRLIDYKKEESYLSELEAASGDSESGDDDDDVVMPKSRTEPMESCADEEPMEVCTSPSAKQPADRSFIFELDQVNDSGSILKSDLHEEGYLDMTGVRNLSMSFDLSKLGEVFNEKESTEMDDHPSYTDVCNDNKKTVELSDCLKLFTQEEKLQKTDTWYCPKCKNHVEAKKKFDLWKLPKYLVVQLKRFTSNYTYRDKLDTYVDYPVKDLDLKPWVVSDQKDCQYDLIAVSIHFGGLGGGHYTAYAKNHKLDKWFYFDDSSVSSASDTEVVSKSGYILVYEKKSTTPDDF